MDLKIYFNKYFEINNDKSGCFQFLCQLLQNIHFANQNVVISIVLLHLLCQLAQLHQLKQAVAFENLFSNNLMLCYSFSTNILQLNNLHSHKSFSPNSKGISSSFYPQNLCEIMFSTYVTMYRMYRSYYVSSTHTRLRSARRDGCDVTLAWRVQLTVTRPPVSGDDISVSTIIDFYLR